MRDRPKDQLESILTEVQPELNQLEALRKRKWRWFGYVELLLPCICAVWIYFLQRPDLYIPAGVLFIIFTIFFRKFLFQPYIRQIENPIFQSLGPRLLPEYEPIYPGFSAKEFRHADLMLPRSDLVICQYQFAAKWGSLAYRFAPLRALASSESTDSKGNRQTSYTTTFEGLFIEATWPTETAQTQIGAAKAVGFSFKKVTLEDPIFHRFYRATSTDQVKARYLLPLDRMNRLTKWAKEDRPCLISWKDGTLYIGLWYKLKKLEPSILSKAESAKFMKHWVEFLQRPATFF